jgi:hypothetical protein
MSNAKLEGAFGVSIADWRSGLVEVVSAIPA